MEKSARIPKWTSDAIFWGNVAGSVSRPQRGLRGTCENPHLVFEVMVALPNSPPSLKPVTGMKLYQIGPLRKRKLCALIEADVVRRKIGLRLTSFAVRRSLRGKHPILTAAAGSANSDR